MGPKSSIDRAHSRCITYSQQMQALIISNSSIDRAHSKCITYSQQMNYILSRCSTYSQQMHYILTADASPNHIKLINRSSSQQMHYILTADALHIHIKNSTCHRKYISKLNKVHKIPEK